MSKRALMLTAATAALLTGHALAQTTIDNKVTTEQSTSTDGTITITTAGSIVITTNPPTGPAVTIDGGTTPGSAADVYNQGTISYAGFGSATAPLTGIEMLGGSIGGLDNAAKIDFSGAGTNKTGILIASGTGSFIGDIMCTEDSSDCSGDSNSKGTPVSQLVGVQDTNVAAILLESGSSLKIQGDSSYGIDIAQGATLGDTCTNCASDIDIGGALAMTPTSSSSTSSDANAIYLAGTMNGDINLIEGGTISVEGTSSYGINMVAPNSATNTPGGILNGSINIDGNLAMTPINVNTLTSGGNIAMFLGGTINGNVDIETGGVVSSEGAGAEGIVIAGPINGDFENQNELVTYGTSNPKITGGNPDAAAALIVEANITGGIFNAGPAYSGDTTTSATISTVGNAPTVIIGPNPALPSSIVIGSYTSEGDVASFLNRGAISNSSENPNPLSPTTAIDITGDSANYTVDLVSGIFNAGSITSSAATNSSATGGASTTDIIIGPYATVASLTNSNEDPASPGRIAATLTGERGGDATAIDIEQNGSLPSIVNDGTIAATAITSNPLLGNGGLKAIAILDSSGSLTSIVNNTGALIEATASLLQDNSQVAIAADLEANTTGVTFDNYGTVSGDIRFGSGDDILLVQGAASNQEATVTGNIYFGGNSSTGDDTLHIAGYGSLTGQVYAGSVADPTVGKVDVTVDADGTLNLLTAASGASSDNLQNTTLVEGTTLIAGNFDLAANSTVDIHYSQAFNLDLFPTAVIVNAENEATIDTSSLTFTPDSFIAPPIGEKSATFVVLESPILTILPSTLSTIQSTFLSSLSYLYSPLESGVSLNGAGNELLLTITPKTIGSDGCKSQLEVNNCNLNDIPLSGYAAKLFPYANVALGNDNALGSAVIQGVTNSFVAQTTYSNFAPDVSGATRALAISLTDDATSVVAARQRELREYANQDGDLTLWGQQFVQRLNQSGTLAGPGYHDSGFGFALGADQGDAVDGRYGGAFTFYSGDTREQAPRLTKTTSEWFMATGYTDWRGKGLFLDTNASLGYASLTGSRYMDLLIPNGNGGQVPFNRDATDSRPAEYLSGGATTGVRFDESGTIIMPQVSLDGLVMRQESYNESGGGNGFDLHVSSSYAQSLRAFTGVDVRQDFDFTDFLLQPEVRVGYRYDFANGAESVNANFESVTPPSDFQVTGPQPDKGNIVAGGGLAVSTGAWSLGLSFDYLKAGSGNTSEEGTLTLLGRI